jgi:hypothetical protein
MADLIASSGYTTFSFEVDLRIPATASGFITTYQAAPGKTG